jgi:hypothetical protein
LAVILSKIKGRQIWFHPVPATGVTCHFPDRRSRLGWMPIPKPNDPIGQDVAEDACTKIAVVNDNFNAVQSQSINLYFLIVAV